MFLILGACVIFRILICLRANVSVSGDRQKRKIRYQALQQFLSVKRTDTVGSYISDIEKSRSDIISDLQSDREFIMGSAEDWVASGRHDILVSLEEILNYISWGIIYQDSHHFGGKHLGKSNRNSTWTT